MEYTYELPDNQKFLRAVEVVALKKAPSQDLRNKFKIFFNGTKCELKETSEFSHERWNAYSLYVEFFVPFERLDLFNDDILLKSVLERSCKEILPGSAGYDIKGISISPDIYGDIHRNAIEEIVTDISNEQFIELNEDLIEKGKQMAKAYTTLYALENHLRNFIDKILVENFGNDYSSAISTKIRKSINDLKEAEKLKKWLPLRGNNDLYYLDFIKLADLIINNWDIFKEYIPSQEWIKVKIDEMYNIRCLIAHNSYISDENFDLLNITTKQILKQIS